MVGGQAVVKRQGLDHVVLGRGRVGEQFEEQVFDRVDVRDYQGELVEFVGFPETGAPGFNGAGVALEEYRVLELFYTVLSVVLPACVHFDHSILVNQSFLLLQSRKTRLTSHERITCHQLLPRGNFHIFVIVIIDSFCDLG